MLSDFKALRVLDPAAPGEPARYLPTGARSYVRIVAPDDVQAGADTKLTADRVHLGRRSSDRARHHSAEAKQSPRPAFRRYAGESPVAPSHLQCRQRRTCELRRRRCRWRS